MPSTTEDKWIFLSVPFGCFLILFHRISFYSPSGTPRTIPVAGRHSSAFLLPAEQTRKTN